MAVRTLILALIALAGTASPSLARPFEIPLDHASLIRLPEDASAVVIGNPTIADATLYDGRTLFVTGKLYGRTNLIALDPNGRVIYTSDLVVSASDRGRMQVFRNTDRESYTCAPDCQAAPAVGDSEDSFASRTQQQQRRQQIAGEASANNAGAEEG